MSLAQFLRQMRRFIVLTFLSFASVPALGADENIACVPCGSKFFCSNSIIEKFRIMGDATLEHKTSDFALRQCDLLNSKDNSLTGLVVPNSKLLALDEHIRFKVFPLNDLTAVLNKKSLRVSDFIYDAKTDKPEELQATVTQFVRDESTGRGARLQKIVETQSLAQRSTSTVQSKAPSDGPDQSKPAPPAAAPMNYGLNPVPHVGSSGPASASARSKSVSTSAATVNLNLGGGPIPSILDSTTFGNSATTTVLGSGTEISPWDLPSYSMTEDAGNPMQLPELERFEEDVTPVSQTTRVTPTSPASSTTSTTSSRPLPPPEQISRTDYTPVFRDPIKPEWIPNIPKDPDAPYTKIVRDDGSYLKAWCKREHPELKQAGALDKYNYSRKCADLFIAELGAWCQIKNEGGCKCSGKSCYLGFTNKTDEEYLSFSRCFERLSAFRKAVGDRFKSAWKNYRTLQKLEAKKNYKDSVINAAYSTQTALSEDMEFLKSQATHQCVKLPEDPKKLFAKLSFHKKRPGMTFWAALQSEIEVYKQIYDAELYQNFPVNRTVASESKTKNTSSTKH